MAELLETYDLKGNFLGVVERNKFCREIKKEFSKKGHITRQVKRVGLLLLNSEGKIYIQKRGHLKKENAKLYDKTVGGHLIKGDSFDTGLIRESAEEIVIPIAPINEMEFEHTIKKIDVRVIGICKQIEVINNFQSVRIMKNGEKFVQPYITANYVGYHDGNFQIHKREVGGIELFTKHSLKKAIKSHPEKFTEDLKFMVKKYEKYLKPIK